MLLLFLVLTFSVQSHAAEVARTRDGDRWLISKSQGEQDWLITYDASRGTVSGSVRSGSGEPTLLDCDVTSFSSDAFYLSCYAAIPNGWEFAATTNVTREFLGYPDNPGETLPTPRPTAQPTPRPTPFKTPKPTTAPCPNVAGYYATQAEYTCGSGSGNIALQQTGCRVSGTINSLNSLVPVTGFLSATVGPDGRIDGTVSVAGTCIGNLDISAPPDGLGRYIFPFESVVTCSGSASFCNIIAGTLILY